MFAIQKKMILFVNQQYSNDKHSGNSSRENN